MWVNAGFPLNESTEVQLSKIAVSVYCNKDDVDGVVALLGNFKGTRLQQEELFAQLGPNMNLANPQRFADLVVHLCNTNPIEAAHFCMVCKVSYTDIQHFAAALQQDGRARFLQTFAGSLGAKNPNESIDFVNAISPDDLPNEATSLVCASLLRCGAGQVTQWLSSKDPGDQASLLDNALTPLDTGHNYPFGTTVAAKAWLDLRLKLPTINEKTLHRVFDEIVYQTDEKILFGYINDFPASMKNDALLVAYRASGKLAEEMKIDPKASLNTIQSLPKAISNDVLIDTLVRCAAENPGKAFSLVRETHSEELATRVLDRVLCLPSTTVSLEDKQKMLNEASTLRAVNPEGLSGLGSFMEQCVSANPKQGVDMCNALPQGALKDQAVISLAKAWSTEDPIAASEWMAIMPAGRLRDLAVGQLVPNTTEVDPQISLLNARQIGDPRLRAEAAQKVITTWAHSNREWICNLAKQAGYDQIEIDNMLRRSEVGASGTP